MNQLNNLSKFDRFFFTIKGNRWYWYFSVFCRVTLAYAFIVVGAVKIAGERFASGLSVKHPMGAYLEALQHTGYYYTFIGIAQLIAAILLLIPRTAILGALLYFPIIVNIWVLSFAMRFEGSFITSPLMVLANLYLLIWNYDRLRYILPFKRFSEYGILPKKPGKFSNKFPILFFTAVATTIILIVAVSLSGYIVMPRNSLTACKAQFINTPKETAGCEFCDCVHKEGKPLNECLEKFENAIKKKQE